MFRPRFSEGVELGKSGHLELPLPDEDPDAMAVVCKVLHHREDSVSMTPAEILAIASIADEYDCPGAFNYHAYCWIAKQIPTYAPETLWQLLIAAFFFRQTATFQELSETLALYLHPACMSMLRPQPNTPECPKVLATMLGMLQIQNCSQRC